MSRTSKFVERLAQSFDIELKRAEQLYNDYKQGGENPSIVLIKERHYCFGKEMAL